MKPFKKILGIFRNPAVRRELESLDPATDHQRMVHLGLCYEFPFDMIRANELALFATYASVPISSLLDRTGEFAKHGQKRYDDTRFLITKFAEDGYDGPFGQRAIAQMNKIHGNFRIPNEDFIFVLSTLIFYPIDWMEKYSWRKMTNPEKQALFLFYREVGLRMGMTDLPATMEDLRAFVAEYETKHLVFAQSNRNIADATINIFKGWFPRFLRPLIEPAVVALIDEKLRVAFGFPKPSAAMVWVVNVALKTRKHFLRWVPVTFMPYPNLTDTTRFRTYHSEAIVIENVKPTAFQN
ncbi:MAG: DUF2236 domain-containing protein [Phycisphaerae bacterium]|nr:DUF2236 domain-containing protein [Saprospiraceae bacterium]